jgi:Ser/Thr protein kinase RdoA (MazF antagonist)
MLASCDPPLQLGDCPMGISVMRPFLDTECHTYGVSSHNFTQTLRSRLAGLEPRLSGFDKCVCHGDLFLENVLFDASGRLAALIDFEEMCAAPAVLDVAMTVVGCCFNAENKLQLGLVKALLRGYQQSRPLSAVEKGAFAAFVEYSLLSIALWRFKQFRFVQPDPLRKDAYLEMLKRLDEVDSQQQQLDNL